MTNSSTKPGELSSLTERDRAILAEIIKRGLTFPTSAHEQYGAYWRDPVPFVHKELKLAPWETQQRIMRSVANHGRTAVRSCHHSGKTFAAAALAHWWVRAFEPSLVLTTAPTERQVKDVLWNEIRRQQAKGGLGGELLTTSLKVSTTQRAFGFTTNTPEKFQGWHEENILIIVDEASGVDETIYEAIEGCLTGPNAKILLIGNPNSAAGTFFEAFSSPLYEKFHISASDVPENLLPAGWAEERLGEWGADSPAYRVRVLGEFPDEGDDTLFPLSWVERAQESDGAADASGHTIIGVDIARFGGDESVAYVRRGNVVVCSAFWRGNDTMASAGRVASLAKQWGSVRVQVDEIGVGAGVVDRLRSDGVPAVGINVGTSPRDKEKYQMLRDEIFFGLRERFRAGEISIPKDDGILLSQLTALKYSYLPTGKLKVESKDDLRKRRGSSKGWQSPDRGDALALCFAPPPPQPVFVAAAGRSRPAF